MERMELPKVIRSMGVVTAAGSVAAPSVSRSGTKWSAVGCATATPGPLV